MHDEPPFSWRTEAGLFLTCVLLSGAFVAGCWLAYHAGELTGDGIRFVRSWLA